MHEDDQDADTKDEPKVIAGAGCSYTYSTPNSNFGNVTIGNLNTANNSYYVYNSGAWSSNSAYIAPSQPAYTIAGSNGTTAGATIAAKLSVEGENADIVINGKSMCKFMETIESRLAILQPNLEKLEHFAALKKAYEHYKALEALCELPKEEDDNS